MGGSILELQGGSSAAGGLILAIGASWRAVGRAGRVTTAVAAVALCAVTWWWTAVTQLAVPAGLAVAALLVAAVVDAAHHRLPNVLVAVGAVPVVTAVVAAWSGDLTTSTLLGAAFLGGPLLLTHLVAPAGMGFGDVKAGAVLGAALGLLAAPLALLALVAGLTLAATVGLARRAPSIALGPALVAGALVALAVGRLVGVEVVQP